MIAVNAKVIPRRYFFAGVILLVAALLVCLLFGAVSIELRDLYGLLKLSVTEGWDHASEAYPMQSAILLHIRLPRILAAVCAGGALAMAGTCTQGLFRNPLASPDVLGVSAGSSFGAVIGIASGLSASHPLWIPLMACVGALSSALFVFSLASRTGTGQTLYIILAGLALSSLLGGATMGVLLFAKQYEINQFVFWTMGGLEGRLWQHVLWPLPLLVLTSVWLWKRANWLNILSLGDESAHGLGLNVPRARFTLLLSATILTALSIAVAGPIGFIGLMVPHMLRLLTGANHLSLLPLSALFGSVMLLVCDFIGRYAMSPYEIKAGIITAIIGGLYFVALIVRVQSKGKVI